ncbi:hypothetical protein [Streptomyces venezuelae]|uniref:Uncharacterized protein n=1 Tax=Streptomyces venezuelae TaxID=54571 RepID=A0A5P2BQ61_STRVZ|nr:hypothetical protein [Streptomyces venezuelae]QES32463.1 hypothetical protein DEJ48_02745 [Streptomyces venezuelae]
MNVTRNVKPRDLADWPACRYLALFFWSWTALITFGHVSLVAVVAVAWAQPLTSVVPAVEVTLIQIGLTVAVLTPLHFAPGVRRLARSARYALLGPLATVIVLAVFLCVGGA